MAIVFFVLLSQYSQRTPKFWMLDLAVVIFIVAAVTDAIDGYIARKRGLVTALGRVLDPFVDKVLVCGAFIIFAGPGFVDADGHNVTEVTAWMVVVIVGRELLVTGLRGFSESRGKAFGASLHGKVKMWMQSIAAPAVLLIVAHEHSWPEATWPSITKKALVWAMVVVTALSAVQYIIRSRDILEESGS
ncbi:MAG: CDP-diacylglycerol--glycerol-3-phosphate 3-phosphatidyltransferase [Planctomycetes bacterium]|nr:CDP-diacylglycerol--glycerol-3-phosphate 3-phosphatidyltransferase [Planctomycetota bacterium]